jgi:hypothetical protein
VGSSIADLVAWAWAFFPRRARLNDASVKGVTGANLIYQVHPQHAGLIDEVIDWYDGVPVGLDRTVCPTDAEEFALKRWVAHGYETDPSSRGDYGGW